MLALCLLIMLIVPPICKKIGMPAIFGLILSGIVVGPHGFRLVDDQSGLEVLSGAGLLYLMFLMTLETDIYSFRKNRFKSVWFGAFTFLIPFVSGYFAARHLFGYDNAASLLLACMFSSHTLVSYPVAARLNITKTEPVVVSIGGTIITDVTVLLLLTFITVSYEGTLDIWFWCKTVGLLGGFIFLMLWIFPKVSRWYFARFQSDDTGQFIFVLCALFGSGMLADWAGIEPIVGAFLCGLALNRVIPRQSALMSRTVFVGNSLFIPFFMIHIGTLVDLKAFTDGMETFILAAGFIVIALFGKYLAAFATQLFYKYTRAERLLLFGLSSSHAAATIAVVVIGYNLGIFNNHILNAGILIILFTCLISAYYTDFAGRKVAAQQEQKIQDSISDRILLPLSNPHTAVSLFDFAVLVHQPHEESTIYPVTIATAPAQMAHSILRNKALQNTFTNRARAASVRCYFSTRLDSNISEGIIRASLELQTTHIIIGWSGQSETAHYFFGSIMDKLLENCTQTLFVTRLTVDRLIFGKIYVLVPRYAEHETGFHAWLTAVRRMWQNTSAHLLFIGDTQALTTIMRMKETASLTAKNYRATEQIPDMLALAEELTATDLFVVVAARPNTVSFNRKTAVMPRVITRYFARTSSVIVYPEQPDIIPDNLGMTFGV
ncbi:MAG: cation:proton antiporter [Bacteroidales bacterium]|jgi:Kef-type K+ transport system membrane component KefB|nr:cation:proton antiporter [Bacteroidales bacterium]